MGLISFNYYNFDYLGEPIAEADFPRAEAKAERIINQLTRGRAEGDAFSALPERVQDAVKNAVCAQVEYYAINGTDISVTGEAASGFTVGKVSVTGGNRSAVNAGASMVCPAALAALEQTGLLNPQVDVIDSASIGRPWGW